MVLVLAVEMTVPAASIGVALVPERSFQACFASHPQLLEFPRKGVLLPLSGHGSATFSSPGCPPCLPPRSGVLSLLVIGEVVVLVWAAAELWVGFISLFHQADEAA